MKAQKIQKALSSGTRIGTRIRLPATARAASRIKNHPMAVPAVRLMIRNARIGIMNMPETVEPTVAERFRNFRVALVAGILFLALSLINIPGRINTDCLGSVAAIALFAVVFYLSPRLLRFKAVSAPVQKLAALSYCVFLVQHVTIGWTQMAYIKVFDKMHLVFSAWNVTGLLLVTFLVILAVAWVLKWASDKIVK